MLIPHYHTEGTVSHIFNLGPSFYLMKFRIICCKKIPKGYPFFVIK